MEALDQLWEVYHDWKRLSQKEAEAIKSADWSCVLNAQEGKRGLQPQIIRLTHAVNSEAGEVIDPKQFNERLRAIVNELILMESQNNLTLQARMDAAREARQDLEATSNRLRRVHNSYVPARGSVWENLS